jgi:hypothetical protein
VTILVVAYPSDLVDKETINHKWINEQSMEFLRQKHCSRSLKSTDSHLKLQRAGSSKIAHPISSVIVAFDSAKRNAQQWRIISLLTLCPVKLACYTSSARST